MPDNQRAIPAWARAYGAPLLSASMRSTPADFVVVENLDIDFSGEGEHDLLLIRKTGANTAWVARQLHRHAGVAPNDVGYAGLKDRHAITTQWFSVRRPGAAGTDWQGFDADGVEILKIERHRRKLRRGAHRGNTFRIALRSDAIAALRDELRARAELIAANGVPNYFGEQRFGRDGGNVALARQVFAGRRVKRDKRGIALSAARSFLFNTILDARVNAGTWNRLLPGELVNLDGSGSIFELDDTATDLDERLRTLDIHPSGALWGDGAPRATAVVADIESKALAGHGELVDGLLAARVDVSSRPLRVRVCDLQADIGGDVLWLEFSLPRGSFATAVIREIARVVQ